MLEKYPSKEVYYSLYQRFLSRDPYELVKFYEGSLEKKSVLDVCAGNGRLSQSIIDAGHRCEFTLLDREFEMLPSALNGSPCQILNYDIDFFIENFSGKNKYDVIFCQQAVNYWLKKVTLRKFADLFNLNGQFIFNTFNKKPGSFADPTIKSYKIDDNFFREISYFENGKIYHIQIMNDETPHLTSFGWLSDEEIYKLLSPFFNIKAYIDGPTTIYNCSLRDE